MARDGFESKVIVRAFATPKSASKGDAGWKERADRLAKARQGLRRLIALTRAARGCHSARARSTF
jgi:hypothetical protein